MIQPDVLKEVTIVHITDFDCLHQRFSFVANKFPNHVAVVAGRESISYAQMDAKTEHLAQVLAQRGICKGDRIGVFMDRSIDFPILVLAIVKAGAVFVPLDPSYPQTRLEMMIKFSKLSLIICDHLLISHLPATTEIITLAGLEANSIAKPTILPEIRRDDPAYIMFTSGSTGNPKGVVIPHRGILRLVIDPNYVRLGANEIIPQISAISFDASTFEIWGALLNGGTLAVPPQGKLSVSEIGEFLHSSEATTALFSTGFFHLIVDEQPQVLASLRQVLIGGDVLSSAHVRRLLQIAPDIRIINGYGPTEATTFAVCYTAPVIESVPDPLPIGHPINATSLHIFNEQMNPVKTEEEGELYIGGDGLALGYMDNDAETAARFIPNPDTYHADKILYKTGDLARRNSDGSYMFLGRADQQVKIRGFRIELGEIEARLRDHELIRDVIVVAKQNETYSTEKSLAAYVILTREEDAWRKMLTEHLKAVLPPFMIPSDWATLTTFPLGPTGKVDRKAITAIPIRTAENKIASNTFIDESLSKTEMLVCNLCAEILNISGFTVDDNFMGLGGDSLSAARLASRIATGNGVSLKLGEVLSSGNLREIARRIDDIQARPVSEITELLYAHPESRIEYPVSYAQEQLWLIYSAMPQSVAYNEPCLITIPVAIEEKIMEKALATLAARHAIFRTTYGMKEEVPFQLINEHFSIPLTIHSNITKLDFDDLAMQDIAQPFDLVHGPLVRAHYAIFSDGSAKLLLVMHHIAFDGISLFNTLVPELQKLCFSQANDTLPPVKIRYADFAEWQRRVITQATLQPALQFWEKQLDAVEPIVLPFRLEQGASEGHSHAFHISLALATKLRTLAKHENVSLFSIMAAALTGLLRRYTYQDDIAIAFVQSSRPSEALDNVIGGFVNTLALRTQIEPNSSLRSLVQQVWKTIREAQDNEAPYEIVVAHVAQKLQLRGRALLNILISYDPPMPTFEHGWAVDHLAYKKSDPKFPLSVELGDAQDGSIYGRIEHNTSFLPMQNAERLREHFWNLLEEICTEPEQLLDQVNILSSAEVNTLITNQSPELSDAKFTFIEQMLEEAERLHPEREALVFGKHRLSYAELMNLANQKAQALQVIGVGSKKVVALLFKDPLQRCIAAWSVWLAGGAIVSLDPEYPQERINESLNQIGPVLVLTEHELLPQLVDHEAVSFEQLTAPTKASPIPEAQRSADDLAYIIFTSGSTGKPKGVMISHHNACAMVNAHIEVLGPETEKRSLQMAGPGFDAYISELLFACANAGTLVLAERQALLPGAELAALINREQINDVFFTPSLLAYLDPADYPSLKTITSAGESCPPDLATQWIKSGVRFIHAYGPAEATICTTIAVIDSPRADFLPLGKALPGYKLYLLDPRGNIAPTGAIGEIHIGGSGVGVGYLPGSPSELRFIPDSFSDEVDARLYRTGDMARFNAQGELEFMGRNDSQIKIRGMRVELNEIEAVILEDADIRSTVVQPILSENNATAALGAIVCFRNPPQANWRITLTEQLRRRLPGHMVPTYFTSVESMPITANGKIDQRNLPSFTTEDRSLLASRQTSSVQLTEDEQVILSLWKKVFPVVEEDPATDFFELGGHSLLAVKLVALFNAHFGTSMLIRSLFENPTIREMAEWLHNTEDSADARTVPLSDAMANVNIPSEVIRKHTTKDILLTGASGFVGRHLLWELLESTDADIYCIARGPINNTREHLAMLATTAGPFNKNWLERIKVVTADFTSPNFLIEEDPLYVCAFRSIYHCGALVNSIYPYTATRVANVVATQRLLELAGRCGADFNHISTVGVFEHAERSHHGIINENEIPLGPPPVTSGYNCSKWVAEKLVQQASEKGLTTRIFRLGRVAWSNRTGNWNTNDFAYRLMKGCIQLGAMPDWEMDFRMISVDFLAEAVVAISQKHEIANKDIYHLIGNTEIKWQTLSEALRERYKDLKLLSHSEWWNELVAAKTNGQENVLSTLVDKLAPTAGILNVRPPEFAVEETNATLHKIGLTERYADIAQCPLE
jgi:amino acid adenylation domain-containing protein/thioester reductase-like protein